MAKRNRIIYASMAVFVDGMQVNRAQTFGSTSTFTSTDIFQLGQLDIIDVVDEIPAVAVTLDTNNTNGIETLAKLAKVNPVDHLIAGGTNYNGVALSDFAKTGTKGCAVWCPIQDESKVGVSADNTIVQTMFMDEVYVNSIEFALTTGANATENYRAETDNKKWLLNAGKYVSQVSVSGAEFVSNEVSIAQSGITICGDGSAPSTLLTGSKVGFLARNDMGKPSVNLYDVSEDTYHRIPIESGADGATRPNDHFLFFKDSGTSETVLLRPSGVVDGYDFGTMAAGDLVSSIFCADGYSTKDPNVYFDEASASGSLGALRQGQIEAFIVDKGASVNSSPTWRLTGVTITSDLAREALMELGHLRAYDRPVTLPLPITLAVESTASDLETWALFAGKEAGYAANTIEDLDIFTLLAKKDLSVVAYLYHQTDEEAGGSHEDRKWKEDTTISDTNGVSRSYLAGDREYPQKMIVVKNIYPTEEAFELGVGANGTQRYGFNARNALYVIDTRDIGTVDFATLEANITSIEKAG